MIKDIAPSSFTGPFCLTVLPLEVQDVPGIAITLVDIVEALVEIVEALVEIFEVRVEILEASAEIVGALVEIIEEGVVVIVDDVLNADITGDVLATVFVTAIDGTLLEQPASTLSSVDCCTEFGSLVLAALTSPRASHFFQRMY